MKLTNATEQALAVVAVLSTQKGDTPVSSITIYKKLALSQSYVSKLLRKLVVANIITGVSGNNGGFYIEKKVSDITLLDIVEAIEGPLVSFPNSGVLARAFSEFSNIAQSGEVVVSEAFRKADSVWDESLRKITVADVLHQVFREYEDVPRRNWNTEIEG